MCRGPPGRSSDRVVVAWTMLYALVGAQMGWILRPFIGAPGIPTRFLREGAWSNAYVEVFAAVARLFGS